MSVNLEVHKYDAHPTLRSFLFHGMPPVPRNVAGLRFDVATPADRVNAVKDAQDAHFPIGVELLRLPYFKRLVIRNIKDAVPCIDLTVSPETDWNAQSKSGANRPTGKMLMDQSLQTASIETIVKNKIVTFIANAPKLIGDKELTSSYNLAALHKDASDFVDSLKVQETVRAHGGKLWLHSIDTASGIATIIMEGNCGSGDSCQGSQIITRANVSQSLRVQFPDVIIASRFLTAAPSTP